jgi:hypothetical protein
MSARHTPPLRAGTDRRRRNDRQQEERRQKIVALDRRRLGAGGTIIDTDLAQAHLSARRRARRFRSMVGFGAIVGGILVIAFAVLGKWVLR